MTKSYYAYHDEKVTRVGTVTMVDGSLKLTDKAFNELQDKFYDLCDKMEQVTNPMPIMNYTIAGAEIIDETQIDEVTDTVYYATSYSKCDPTDDYNSKTGLIVASRKTEEKLTRRALKDVTELKDSLRNLLTLVETIEDKLAFANGKLVLDLVRFKKEGK